MKDLLIKHKESTAECRVNVVKCVERVTKALRKARSRHHKRPIKSDGKQSLEIQMARQEASAAEMVSQDGVGRTLNRKQRAQ